MWKAAATVAGAGFIYLAGLFLYVWEEYYYTAQLTDDLRKTYSRNILKEEYQQHCCSSYGLKCVWNIFYWKYLFRFCCYGCHYSSIKDATSQELTPILNSEISQNELETMCQNYGQYNLKRSNFCIRRKYDQAENSPVIFLIVLDWLDQKTNLKDYYEDLADIDKENCHVDILHAAIDRDKRQLRRDAKMELLNDRYKKGVKALTKDTKSICLVLKDFPVNWQESRNPFLRQVRNFIEVNDAKLLYIR